MTTFFLRKNIFRVFAAYISIFFVLLSLGYCLFLSQTLCVPVYTHFYVLASKTLHVEAGAEFVKLEGGAGYVLCWKKQEYVVLSVYQTESEGESIYAAVANKIENVRFFPISVKYLYFKGSQRKRAKEYLAALQSLEEYLSLIENCVSLLEKGTTQESAKRILAPTRSQIAYSAQSFKEVYPAYARLCGEIAEDLSNVENNLIYARDLRYISCEIVDGYLRLCKQFSL